MIVMGLFLVPRILKLELFSVAEILQRRRRGPRSG
jgi:hypothetical protein